MWQQQRLWHETQLKVGSWRPLIAVQRFHLLPCIGFVLTRWENPDAARCSSLGGCTRATDFPFSHRANKLQKKGNFIRKHFVFGLANCRQKRKERVFYCPEIDDKTLGKIWKIQYFVFGNAKPNDSRKNVTYSIF